MVITIILTKVCSVHIYAELGDITEYNGITTIEFMNGTVTYSVYVVRLCQECFSPTNRSKSSDMHR